MEFNLQNTKLLRFNSLITCIYLPIVISFVNYTGNLYKIGKPETAFIEVVLMLAEVLKYIKYYFSANGYTQKSYNQFRVYNFFKGIFMFVSMVPVFYITAVLFGAPLLADQYETFSFALLLTILTVLPSCLFLGPDSIPILFMSLTSFEGNEIFDKFLFNIRLTIFGAWLGAVLIPLDWDKPYQEWPIPCYLGAIAGYFVSNFVNFVSCLLTVPPKKTGKFHL